VRGIQSGPGGSDNIVDGDCGGELCEDKGMTPAGNIDHGEVSDDPNVPHPVR